MQIVLQWSKCIQEYQSGFEKLEFEKPEKCKCGCIKFHKWGKYKRFVADVDGDYLILIKRICCIKCRATYSYLPTFCISKSNYSADFIMLFLKVLMLKFKYELGEIKRHAYTYLNRFIKFENLWIAFLRTRGLGCITADIKERRTKILTKLIEIYESKNFMMCFLQETGRHFMT